MFVVKLILMFAYKELNYLMTSCKCNSQCTQIVILLLFLSLLFYYFEKQPNEKKQMKKGLEIGSLGNKHVNC